MAYEKKIIDSDRYQFLVDTEIDTVNFKAGTVIRASFGDMLPLLEAGILQEVEMYTLCRINPLAPGGCAPQTSIEQLSDTNQEGKKER